jgi:hypothetical protein
MDKEKLWKVTYIDYSGNVQCYIVRAFDLFSLQNNLIGLPSFSINTLLKVERFTEKEPENKSEFL